MLNTPVPGLTRLEPFIIMEIQSLTPIIKETEIKDREIKDSYTPQELLDEYIRFDDMTESLELISIRNSLTINQLFAVTKQFLQTMVSETK